MTWIILTGLTCATVILFANHSMAIARLNRLEQELLDLRMQEWYRNPPEWRNCE